MASFWYWAQSALTYVIQKVCLAAAIPLQAAVGAALTVADSLAYILSKGIKLAGHVSSGVLCLIRKFAQALGMKVSDNAEDLNRQVITSVLKRMTSEAHRNAERAARAAMRP